MKRRDMLRHCVAAGAAVAAGNCVAPWARAAEAKQRKFTLDLCPGRIGVNADQSRTIQYAAQFGFESVEPFGPFLAALDLTELDALRTRMADAGVVWGAAGLPVEFRRDEESFQRGVAALPEVAAGLQRAGVKRMGTWLSPGHDELTYLANFHQHARRLRAVAEVLAGSGLRLGLEYVGPKTSWTARRYAFIHTLAETQELINEIGRDNVGLVLDSWHWYTAGEGLADIASLSGEEVVAVDLNDAPRGVARDEQIDNRRTLPMATGVIDLQGFMNSLAAMGYDGPVRAEPFNRDLNALDDAAALEATADAMRKAFALVRS